MNRANSSLLVRLPNWVGDVMMALPALQAMQQSGIELQLLGKPWISDLLGAMDMPLLSLTNNFWQTRTKLAEITNSNKALLLTNSISSALLTRLAGFATIGYKTDARKLLLTAGVVKGHDQHEVDYFWSIARFASQYWFPQLQWPGSITTKITLPVSLLSIANAKDALLRANISEPYWVICPFAQGTGKNGESKIWPNWRELSKQLAPYNLVVCPGKNEEHLCAELVPDATVLSGLNLGDYAAILKGSERVIANDSGPMHMAAAVGANTLGIFGVTEPKRTAPWGADYIGASGTWPTLSQVLDIIK